jgi:poly(A) polymerase
MIRLIKFCARFQLHIDPTTLEALLDCKNEIVKSSSARILEELLRMLESGASKAFFHLLQEYGLLRPLLPQIAEYAKAHAEENEMLALLCEADTEVRKNPLDRCVLLAALLFPLLRQRLIARAKKGGQFHLGIIHEEALRTIDQAFAPFFVLPRRMHGLTAFVLSSQFRIQPLDDKPIRHPRPPRDPAFLWGLQLFKLRAAIQPELLPLYTTWTEACYGQYPPQPAESEERPRHPRRRRRRRPPE